MAFAGTTWVHNREDHKLTVGEWQAKDGGFKTTVTLQRSVFMPDPAKPGAWIALGQEDIPLGDSNTIFTPQGLAQSPALKIPRWTGMFGVAKRSGTTFATQSSYQPWGGLDFRLTNRYGIVATVQSGSAALGVSVRFGANK
jgi:hypothetical protein